MNDLVLHKLIKFPGSITISQLFLLLCLQSLLLADDFLVIELVLDSLLVLISDLLLNPLL